jgi:hypothetical protein
MITYFNCNFCGHAIKADRSQAGVLVKCNCCGKAVMVPIRSPKPAYSNRSQHQKAEWSPREVDPSSTNHASKVQVLEPEAMEHVFDDSALIQPQPAGAPAKSLMAKFVVGYLAGGILVAVYFGFDPLGVTKAIDGLGATVVRGEGKNDRKSTPEAIEQQTKPNHGNEDAARERLLASARAMMAKVQTLDTSLQKEISYDQYFPALVELQAKVDEVLGTAEETGSFRADADVQQLCKIAVDIVRNHCEALKMWKQENSLVAERKEVRAAHEARIRSFTDIAAINQSLQETTQKLDQLTAQLMATIEARYDLWINTQKQTKVAVEVLSKLERSSSTR